MKNDTAITDREHCLKKLALPNRKKSNFSLILMWNNLTFCVLEQLFYIIGKAFHSLNPIFPFALFI